MKAIVYNAPGELVLADRPVPEPGPDEVLLEVAHLGICGSDLLLWKGGLTRVKPPVVLGHEFCGTVVDANGADGVKEGQAVAVEPLLSCGRCRACRSGNTHVCQTLKLIGIDVDGAAASHVVVPAGGLHPLPENLSLRDAAITEPASVAVHMVRRAGVGIGDRILVLGGGPIGGLVAFVCHAAGAVDVVVSEPNGFRRELLGSLGLTSVDPTAGLVDRLLDRVDGEGFDVVFEESGAASALQDAVDMCRIRGTILLGGLPSAALPLAVAPSVMKELTLIGARVYESRDMDEALRLLSTGRIPAAGLITREVGLEEAIAGAYEPLRSSRDEMKILITPGAESRR